MKKRYITFKSIDSLVNCYTHHQTIQYFSEVGILFTVKFRPPGSPFTTTWRLSVRITSFSATQKDQNLNISAPFQVSYSTDTYDTASELITQLNYFHALPVSGTLQLQCHRCLLISSTPSQVWSSWVVLKDVILIDKRHVVGKGLPGGRNLIVNSTPTSEKY